MRGYDEFVGRIFEIVPPAVLLLILLVVTALIAAGWYWWPAWVPRRWPRLRWPRWRLRCPTTSSTPGEATSNGAYTTADT